MSNSNCSFLTCIEISQEAGQVVWYSHLLKNFPQFVVIHRVKGFGVVNKAEVDVFLELSCFFYDPVDVDNLISGSSACSKSSLNIWKFTILLKPGLENFEHYFTSVWNKCSCAVVWAFFGTVLCPRSGAEAVKWSSMSKDKRNSIKRVSTKRGHWKADRLKPQSQTTSQSDHMDHSLV